MPQAFLIEQGLDNISFYSVNIRKNGQSVDTFDYANNFCRYTVISKHPYYDGEYVSLFIHNQENPYISDRLDMGVPHLLFRNKDGKYELGNKIGRQESLLLVPEGWIIEDDEQFNVEEYLWNQTKLNVIHISSEYKDNIIVKCTDGTITFGMNAPLYWTEMQSSPMFEPHIIESLYDANKCIYTLCYDTEDGVESKRRNVQYRDKWQNTWEESPSYGEIFARAIDNNGNYVTPIKFINIGDGLVVCLEKADKDSCQIKVSWSHGHVTTTEGKRKVNDVWEIKKKTVMTHAR